MKMKQAQLATTEPAAAQDLMIKSILMWFKLGHSCGLRVIFEWLHGSDLGSCVVQTGFIGKWSDYSCVVNLCVCRPRRARAFE